MSFNGNLTVPSRTFYFDLNTVFNLLGSVLTFDYIQLYFVTPVMVIGAFLEIFLIYIFSKKVFAARLYFFLKFYCMNAALLNIISILEPIMGAKRLVPFGYSEAAAKYNSYFYIPLSTLFYSITLLDSSIVRYLTQISKTSLFQ